MSDQMKQNGEFFECESCRNKCGSPELCESCLHNRDVIAQIRRVNSELRQEKRDGETIPIDTPDQPDGAKNICVEISVEVESPLELRQVLGMAIDNFPDDLDLPCTIPIEDYDHENVGTMSVIDISPGTDRYVCPNEAAKATTDWRQGATTFERFRTEIKALVSDIEALDTKTRAVGKLVDMNGGPWATDRMPSIRKKLRKCERLLADELGQADIERGDR